MQDELCCEMARGTFVALTSGLKFKTNDRQNVDLFESVFNLGQHFSFRRRPSCTAHGMHDIVQPRDQHHDAGGNANVPTSRKSTNGDDSFYFSGSHQNFELVIEDKHHQNDGRHDQDKRAAQTQKPAAKCFGGSAGSFDSGRLGSKRHGTWLLLCGGI
jgi:hypothetical protein